MTTERLRLVLRDLTAVAGFGAMAVSGQVPSWAAILFGAAAVVALSGRRPLADGRSSAVVLLVAVVALYAAVALGGMDLVVAACTTAALLTAQRLLGRPGPRTDGQVHLASLLMVSGGAALGADLLYLPCLLAWFTLAALSQGLAVVHEAGSGARPPTRRVLRPLAALAGLGLVGASVFFVLFPRLSWNVANRRGGSSFGIPSVGFSDSMHLGGSGVLKSNPRVVLRARLSPDPGTDRLDAYWVGRRLERFDGRGWTSDETRRRPLADVELTRSPGRDVVEQRIEALPAYGSRTLVGLDTPVRFGSAEVHQGGYEVRTSLLLGRGGHVVLDAPGRAFSYRVLSTRGGPAPATDDGDRAAALALPPGLDARIPALAQRLAPRETEPLAIARRLERELQAGYGYTLELPGETRDPLADFLFVRKAGHCEDFAAALAVLLRARGIPARVVVGFYGGERAASEYIVRAGDAHAWVEAEVDGRTVRLDATPAQGRAGAAEGLTAWLVTTWETLQIRWLAVVDFAFLDQARLAQALRGTAQGASAGASTGPGATPARVSGPWLAGGAALLVLLLLALARGRRRAAEEATRLGEELARALRRAGRLRPGDWLDRADVADPRLADVRASIGRYQAARFGDAPLRPGEARRLLRSARRALGPVPTG